jgi:glutathione S-transferase
MLKLYYVPKTRALRVRWMLEELEVPYELVRLDITKKEQKTPEYLRVHPLGHVPALVDGDLTLFESAAIVEHLADRFPEKRLAPPVGSAERGIYYQWIAFFLTEIEPQANLLARHARFLPEAERVPAVAETALRKLGEAFEVLERALAGRDHLVGERFTAADLLLGSGLGLARAQGLLAGHPALEAYTARVFDRPAAKRARAD